MTGSAAQLEEEGEEEEDSSAFNITDAIVKQQQLKEAHIESFGRGRYPTATRVLKWKGGGSMSGGGGGGGAGEGQGGSGSGGGGGGAEVPIAFFEGMSAELLAHDFSFFTCEHNGWEGSITQLFAQLLSSWEGRGGVVLDVGANSGFYSVLGGVLGFRTYAFEVQLECLELAEEAAASNDVRDLVEPLLLGLADQRRWVSSTMGRCDGSNFVVAEEAERGEGEGREKTGLVLVLSFDEFARSYPGFPQEEEVALVKIDVEGAEALVLRGMREWMGRGRIRNLVVETTPADWKRFAEHASFEEQLGVLLEMERSFGFLCLTLFIAEGPRRLRKGALPFAREVTTEWMEETLPRGVGQPCEGDGRHAGSFFLVLDLERFIREYCLKMEGDAPRGGGGCGNLWFHLPLRRRLLRLHQEANPS